jgi:hypothetical protein
VLREFCEFALENLGWMEKPFKPAELTLSYNLGVDVFAVKNPHKLGKNSQRKP